MALSSLLPRSGDDRWILSRDFPGGRAGFIFLRIVEPIQVLQLAVEVTDNRGHLEIGEE
jgi:hypothetical protein